MEIQELQLLTDDPSGTTHFYNEILGLALISTGSNVTSFSAGSSVLTFYKSEQVQPVYHFALNIPGNRFEEALHWMDKRVQLIEISTKDCVADFKNWNAKAFYFLDNNGNIVEMIARFDLDIDSSNPFTGSSVCSISEIGLVVENPGKYAQQLLANYQMPFFSKQPPTDSFLAMGDDNGLFIIVTENRPWYPTTIRSARHWLKVAARSDGRVMEIVL